MKQSTLLSERECTMQPWRLEEHIQIVRLDAYVNYIWIHISSHWWVKKAFIALNTAFQLTAGLTSTSTQAELKDYPASRCVTAFVDFEHWNCPYKLVPILIPRCLVVTDHLHWLKIPSPSEKAFFTSHSHPFCAQKFRSDSFSSTFRLHSSIKLRDNASQPCTTIGNIIIHLLQLSSHTWMCVLL